MSITHTSTVKPRAFVLLSKTSTSGIAGSFAVSTCHSLAHLGLGVAEFWRGGRSRQSARQDHLRGVGEDQEWGRTGALALQRPALTCCFSFAKLSYCEVPWLDLGKLIACASVWLLVASYGTDRLRSVGLHPTSRGDEHVP